MKKLFLEKNVKGAENHDCVSFFLTRGYAHLLQSNDVKRKSKTAVKRGRRTALALRSLATS
jgi:hypothetical protein